MYIIKNICIYYIIVYIIIYIHTYTRMYIHIYIWVWKLKIAEFSNFITRTGPECGRAVDCPMAITTNSILRWISIKHVVI